jgi:glycine betaine/choline ABC-type transport system substrate-binding protein
MVILLLAALSLASLSQALACVSKTLTIGVVDSPREIIYAELIAQMTTERTGTTVKVQPYANVGELYVALKQGDVGIIIENTDRGMNEVKLPPQENGMRAYEELKREYREKFNLIWLKPVASEGGSRYYAPVMLAETLENLPALPKLINRLTGALSEESYAKLTGEVSGGETRQVARDFLRAKKLI